MKSINLYDKIIIDKNATIDDLTSNHWNGCQLKTLDFLENEALKEKTYTIKDFTNDKNALYLVDENNEEFTLINERIFIKKEN